MSISSNTRKAGPFIGNGTASVFAFTFKVFTSADLEVVKLTVSTGVETVLVITTDYTVALNEEQNSNPGGSITLVAGPLATGFKLVITSDIENLQPTDLTNQGGFFPSVINDSLDRATIQIQQLQEAVDRSAKLPITSSEDAAALVDDIERLADSAANIDTVAGSIANVNTVATNIANVNTVGGISGNVTTVAGISANVTSVAGNAANINTVAGSIANVNAVGTNIAAVNTAATNIAAIIAAPSQAAAAAASATASAASASAASTSATNAASSASAASASQTAAAASATNAATSATASASSATASASSASSSSTSATSSASSASASAASAAAAAATLASALWRDVVFKVAGDSPITVAQADNGFLFVVDTSAGNVVFNLPAISTLAMPFNIGIKKQTGDANTVTINRGGSDTIDGSTSKSIGSQGGTQLLADITPSPDLWTSMDFGLQGGNLSVFQVTGNGTTATYNTGYDPGTENNTWVNIDGVVQLKSTYSFSGSSITLGANLPNGAILEVMVGTTLGVGVPSDGTVTTAKIVDGAVTSAKVDATVATVAGVQSLTNKKLGSLTSNGFVKTGSGDGTLSVDTAAYLSSIGLGDLPANRFKILFISRTMNEASGAVSTAHGITGTPKFAIFVATRENTGNGSWGASNGSSDQYCVRTWENHTWNLKTTFAIWLSESSDDFLVQKATAAFDATNLTLTWTRVGGTGTSIGYVQAYLFF